MIKVKLKDNNGPFFIFVDYSDITHWVKESKYSGSYHVFFKEYSRGTYPDCSELSRSHLSRFGWHTFTTPEEVEEDAKRQRESIEFDRKMERLLDGES